MKKILFSLFIATALFSACSDDNDVTPVEETEFRITANITTNTTWETGKVYILGGRIAVTSGTTLTIQPGVIVKGEAGTGANATALIIARGAKIDAQGTASSPIIFTSIADEIMPGEIASPNLDPTTNGLWGGLIVLGNARISADAPAIQIDGIPVSDQNGLYGGTNDADNSGIIKYVSIRHGGANIGEGNEINGLTLGGVGSGTVIENVEVIANQDDGIEWFGGSVSVKNAIVWNAGDDAIDTDQSWSGTLDNFIVLTPGDECFELDGPEGTYEATHTIKNGTVKVGNAEGIADLDTDLVGNSSTPVNMSNIYFFDITLATQDFDAMPATATLTNFQATLPAGALVPTYFKAGSAAAVTLVTTRTVGANEASFATWSWASVAGELTIAL
ncbi:MAG TPA: hypothetical protein VFM79_04590 [Pelobium sp.]|nr:hypothetical protein [Pelobium sp.]